MDIERRFVFRGNAAVIGGRISRPRDLVIDATGASALTVSGGRSQGSLAATKFGEFARVASAATSAQGVFDSGRLARELTHGRVRADALTTTTTVKVDVRELVVGSARALRIEQLRATMIGTSPGPSDEPALKPSDVRIAGVTIGDHTLVVELDAALFARLATRSQLLAAADDPKFTEECGKHFLISAADDVKGTRRSLLKAEDTIYGTIVRRLRWKGKPYPDSTIDHHLVVAPGFGRVYFGEIFISSLSRRLTLVRMDLGSPIGGMLAAGEIETNGSWYP